MADTRTKKRGRGRPRKYDGALSEEIYTRVTVEQARDFLQLAVNEGYETTTEAIRDLIVAAIKKGKIP